MFTISSRYAVTSEIGAYHARLQIEDDHFPTILIALLSLMYFQRKDGE